MAKIKITESQLKMIAKHKALNEMMDEPKSNSKSADFWNWRESNQDDEIRTSVFEKIERMFDAGKIGEQDAYELMSAYDNQSIGSDEDPTDLNSPKRVYGMLKKHIKGDEVNEMMDEPKESKFITSFDEPTKFKHQYRDELRDAVNKLRKITPEMMDSLSEEKMMELEEIMRTYDDGVGDDIVEIVHSIGNGRYDNDGYIIISIEDDIIDIAYDRIASKGTDKNFIFDAIDDFVNFFGVDDGEEDEYGNEDMPGFEGTMNDLNNLSIRENSISLNEGQLLLKKIYNQFK